MQSVHAKFTLLASGWAEDVSIQIDSSGHIASIEKTPHGATSDVYSLVLPAMPNLHSHAFQHAMAGLNEVRKSRADDFWSWRHLMYGLANRVTPQDLRVIAVHLFTEMVKAGYSEVTEFQYLHRSDEDGNVPGLLMAEALIEAAEMAGIGLTLLPVLYERAGFADDRPQDDQKRFVLSVDDYLSLVEALQKKTANLTNIQVGIGFHSLRAVRREAMRDILQASAAQIPSAPIHIHIAEQVREVEDCVQHLGARPVQWLFDNFEVTEGWCLVHATHIDENEIALIGKSGAVAGLCPTTEANLGDGIFPLASFEDSHGSYGVGSDSQITLNPFDELRWLEYSNRLNDRRRLIDGALLQVDRRKNIAVRAFTKMRFAAALKPQGGR
jgi:formimidoylglutamate deiminase